MLLLIFLDIDECILEDDICGGGACENEDGGYRCICTDGFELSRDLIRCFGRHFYIFHNGSSFNYFTLEYSWNTLGILLCWKTFVKPSIKHFVTSNRQNVLQPSKCFATIVAYPSLIRKCFYLLPTGAISS